MFLTVPNNVGHKVCAKFAKYYKLILKPLRTLGIFLGIFAVIKSLSIKHLNTLISYENFIGDEAMEKAADAMLKELFRWANVLKTMRDDPDNS